MPHKMRRLKSMVFAVTRPSNQITDVIQGITLELTGEGTTTISTSEDLGVAKTTIESLVTAYNSLISYAGGAKGIDIVGRKHAAQH